MKKSKLKEIIKEFVKSNKPQPTPYNPDVETAEPGTETKPVRRRTLTPPTEAPEIKPKAQKEGEEMDLANKIGKRFSKLSKDQLDESVKSRMQKLAGIKSEPCDDCQKKVKEVKINKPSILIIPTKGENLKDFTKRVSKYFIGNDIEGTFSYIDKTKNGYSSKLTDLYDLPEDNYYSRRNPEFWEKYEKNNKYLVNFFNQPKWKSLIQIKMLPGKDEGKSVKFLTKEHPKNIILNP